MNTFIFIVLQGYPEAIVSALIGHTWKKWMVGRVEFIGPVGSSCIGGQLGRFEVMVKPTLCLQCGYWGSQKTSGIFSVGWPSIIGFGQYLSGFWIFEQTCYRLFCMRVNRIDTGFEQRRNKIAWCRWNELCLTQEWAKLSPYSVNWGNCNHKGSLMFGSVNALWLCVGRDWV